MASNSYSYYSMPGAQPYDPNTQTSYSSVQQSLQPTQAPQPTNFSNFGQQLSGLQNQYTNIFGGAGGVQSAGNMGGPSAIVDNSAINANFANMYLPRLLDNQLEMQKMKLQAALQQQIAQAGSQKDIDMAHQNYLYSIGQLQQGNVNNLQQQRQQTYYQGGW